MRIFPLDPAFPFGGISMKSTGVRFCRRTTSSFIPAAAWRLHHSAASLTAASMWPCRAHSWSKWGDLAGKRLESTRVGTTASSQNFEIAVTVFILVGFAAMASLRELLSIGRTIIAPGASDALSAKLIEAHGFDCVYIGSYPTAASRFGIPDTGLVSLEALVEQAHTIGQAVRRSVIRELKGGFL